MLEKDGVLLDAGTLEMLKYSEEIGIDTVFHRALKYNEKTKKFVESNHCPFGSSGVCCRQCNLGPCRIRREAHAINDKTHVPNKSRGVCGATADTIVARNFLMMVSRGMAAHTAHAQHADMTLLLTATGNSNYSIKDEKRLRALADKLEIKFKQTRFEKIKSMLEMGNPECLKLIDTLHRVHGSEKLIHQIENLDFEQALVTLTNLKKKKRITYE